MALVLIPLSCLFPIAGLLGSSLLSIDGRRSVVVCAIGIGLAFASIIMALNITSIGDLSRYIATTETYRGLTFGDFGDTKYSGYFVASTLFWLVANTTGSDTLPFYVAFVVYALSSYVLLDYARCERLARWQTCMAFACLVCLMPLYHVVSALRSSVALSIGVLALYRWCFKGRRDALSVVLFILPCLVHAIGYAVLLMLLLYLISRKFSVASMVLAIVLIPLMLSAASLLAPLASLLNVNLVDKLITYSEWTDYGWAAEVASSLLQRLLRILHVAFAAIVLIVFFKQRINKYKSVVGGDPFDATIICGLGVMVGFALWITVPSYLRLAYIFEPLGILYVLKNLGASRDSQSDVEGCYRFEVFATICLVTISFSLLMASLYQGISSYELVSLLRGMLLGGLVPID